MGLGADITFLGALLGGLVGINLGLYYQLEPLYHYQMFIMFTTTAGLLLGVIIGLIYVPKNGGKK